MILDDKTRKLLGSFPDNPGVYIFLGKKNTRLYIGKATSIKSRVQSYFAKNIDVIRSPLIQKMVFEAHAITYIETPSVLEGLILEANLIKQFQPHYNIKEKDNKSWNYIVITKEEFPRIELIRGHDLALIEKHAEKYIRIFGPYTSGLSLKEALRLIRQIFPFRDACTPFTEQKKKVVRKCFNAQIGLCPGVCSGDISKKEYSLIVRNIILFLEGKKGKLISELTREMHAYAKVKEFEKAAVIKKRIYALEHIQDVSLLKNDFLPKNNDIKPISLEAYDISHLAGEHVVGVMVRVENGVPQKSAYRKFKIRRITKGKNIDDTANLRELLERRLSHAEWELPNLIVIDGSRAQINTAKKVLIERGFNIEIVGVVKNEKHKPREIIGKKSTVRTYNQDILLANSESHRFAINYHKLLRRKPLRDKKD